MIAQSILAASLVAGVPAAHERSPIADSAGSVARENEEASRPSWWKRVMRGEAFRRRAPSEPRVAAPHRRASTADRPPADPPPSDWLLISRCRALLHGDPELASSTIFVSAKDGDLSLRGSVRSEGLRARAERIAEKTEGIRRVFNDLVVMDPEKGWTPRQPVTLSAPVPLGAPTHDLPFETDPPAVGWSAIEPASTQSLAPSAVGATGPIVALGPPQVVLSRPGKPVVVTYLAQVGAPANATAADFEVPAPPHASHAAKTPIEVHRRAEDGRYIIPAPSAPTGTAAPPPMESQSPRTFAPAPATPRASPIDADLLSGLLDGGLRVSLDQGVARWSGEAKSTDALARAVQKVTANTAVETFDFTAVRIVP